MNEIIEDINKFISGIKIKDEADFYTEICDYFDYQKLGRYFELPELIAAYRDCIGILKDSGTDYRKTCVFIKNVVEIRKYNDIQKYHFYLLMHIFFGYLVFDNIKDLADKYLFWIEDQLELINDVATSYYYDFDINKLITEISHQPVREQIEILSSRKKDYLLTKSKFNIPPNDFDRKCDEQIALLREKNEDTTQGRQANEPIEIRMAEDISVDRPVEEPKPKLTLPEILKTPTYGGVKFASEITGYAVTYIRTLAHRGDIPCHKPIKEGHYKFSKQELEEWMSGRKKNSKKPNDRLIGKQGRR